MFQILFNISWWFQGCKVGNVKCYSEWYLSTSDVCCKNWYFTSLYVEPIGSCWKNVKTTKWSSHPSPGSSFHWPSLRWVTNKKKETKKKHFLWHFGKYWVFFCGKNSTNLGHIILQKTTTLGATFETDLTRKDVIIVNNS